MDRKLSMGVTRLVRQGLPLDIHIHMYMCMHRRIRPGTLPGHWIPWKRPCCNYCSRVWTACSSLSATPKESSHLPDPPRKSRVQLGHDIRHEKLSSSLHQTGTFHARHYNAQQNSRDEIFDESLKHGSVIGNYEKCLALSAATTTRRIYPCWNSPLKKLMDCDYIRSES